MVVSYPETKLSPRFGLDPTTLSPRCIDDLSYIAPLLSLSKKLALRPVSQKT